VRAFTCRLWVSTLVGATWLLIFGIFRDKIAVYRTRLVRLLGSPFVWPGHTPSQCAAASARCAGHAQRLDQAAAPARRRHQAALARTVRPMGRPHTTGMIRLLLRTGLLSRCRKPDSTCRVQELAVPCDHDLGRRDHTHSRPGLPGAGGSGQLGCPDNPAPIHGACVCAPSLYPRRRASADSMQPLARMQMLCWTNTLGVQIFAPLTVIGMVLRTRPNAPTRPRSRTHCKELRLRLFVKNALADAGRA